MKEQQRICDVRQRGECENCPDVCRHGKPHECIAGWDTCIINPGPCRCVRVKKGKK